MWRPPKRNVLRRTSDRVESLLVFVLVLAFLAGAPLAAWQAGEASYRSDVRAQQWERQHLYHVPAVLAENAVTDGARAAWTGPDGSARSGTVPAAPGTPVGSRLDIWVDDLGAPHTPPARRSPVRQAILAGTAVALCLAAGLTGLHRIARAVLDRRRDRAWTREWLEVGPRWSRDSGRF